MSKRQGCKKCYVAIKEKSKKKKEFSIFGIDDNGEFVRFLKIIPLAFFF